MCRAGKTGGLRQAQERAARSEIADGADEYDDEREERE
jgi:hypothetical protein